MRILAFLVFIAVPLIELAILIKVGEVIGLLPTILLVIATAIIGVSLLKRQGLATIAKARSTVEAGEFPVESVVDGICLLLAGAFLLTPGLLTDTVGFTLLVPAFRRNLAKWLFDKFKSSGNIHVHTFGTGGPNDPGAGPSGRTPPDGGVIEGEFEDLDPEPGDKEEKPSSGSKSSPWRK